MSYLFEDIFIATVGFTGLKSLQTFIMSDRINHWKKNESKITNTCRGIILQAVMLSAKK